MTYFRSPDRDFVNMTLNGNINNSATTITLSSVTGLQAPGYIVINRVDANGTSTASAREVVFFTGISTNDLTGCTRGANNSTARAHSSGAKVEATMTAGMYDDMRSRFITSAATITTASVGTLKSSTLSELTAGAGITADSVLLKDGGVLCSTATVSTAYISTLNISTISEGTAGAGVTADSVLLKDGGVLCSTATIADVRYSTAKGTLTTDSDGATVTLDMDASNHHKVTLGGNRTIAFSNADVDQMFSLKLIQDATGSRLATWPAGVRWASNATPTLTTTANYTDWYGFTKANASIYEGTPIMEGVPA